MIDRLLSGAGALSHLADRAVRVLLRGGSFAHQPAGLLLAALLALGAVVLLVLGFENAADRTVRNLTAAEAAAGGFGERAFATVEGGLPSAFVETFFDDNGDGEQQADERSHAWDYFLIDPATRTGLTVRSERPPSVIYTYAISGVVIEDPTYIGEDVDYFQLELGAIGVTLDPRFYIDATVPVTGAPHALTDTLPAVGSEVSVQGSRSIDYVTVCSADPDGDGICADDEVDLYDVYVYDPISKRAVVVVTKESPEFAPAAFTGLIRSSPRAVQEAVTADGGSLDDFDIDVSPTFLLTDGATPVDPGTTFGLAAILATIAALITLGVAAGYLRFRTEPDSPVATATMAIGDRIPIRITGTLRGPGGLVHVREAVGDLERFSLRAEVPESDGGPPRAPESTLILERRDRPEGVAVGRGELAEVTLGSVSPLRGPRSALRLVTSTGTVLASFDSVADRDRAAAELAAETGIAGRTS